MSVFYREEFLQPRMDANGRELKEILIRVHSRLIRGWFSSPGFGCAVLSLGNDFDRTMIVTVAAVGMV